MERINTIKMFTLSKAIYIFNAILVKILMTFSTELEQVSLKFVWNHQRPQIAKAVLIKKNKAGSILLWGFRLCYEATVIKSVRYCYKNRHRSVE